MVTINSALRTYLWVCHGEQLSDELNLFIVRCDDSDVLLFHPQGNQVLHVIHYYIGFSSIRTGQRGFISHLLCVTQQYNMQILCVTPVYKRVNSRRGVRTLDLQVRKSGTVQT